MSTPEEREYAAHRCKCWPQRIRSMIGRARKLADLIDPTCRLEFDGFSYACSVCVKLWLWLPHSIAYCPYCGRRIVREEE